MTDPIRMMRRVVDEALILIPAADGAAVELLDDGRLTGVCAAGNLALEVGMSVPGSGSLSGLAMTSGETLSCADATLDERVDREAFLRVGAMSMVCVPLRHGVGPIGVLKVSATRPEAFDADVVAILTDLARFISVAVGAATELALVTRAILSHKALAPTPRPGKSSPFPGSSRGDRIGQFVANVLRPGIVADASCRARIERALAEQRFTIVCQPIIELTSGHMISVEALARFIGRPRQPPDVWLAQAHDVGLGVDLELAVLAQAVQMLDKLPAGVDLAVNLGPEAIAAETVPALLEVAGAQRIVIELTEHLQVHEYPRLVEAVEKIRETGARIGIDDTGAGFTSLDHILKLAPDIIKLDRTITSGIDKDPVRRALARALVSFAEDTGAQIIAEGIETTAELDTIRDMKMPYGQGYLLGRPGRIEDLPPARSTRRPAQPRRAA